MMRALEIYYTPLPINVNPSDADPGRQETPRMNSDDIYALIERIAADPKKTAKEALLREHAGDEELKRVLELAFNPFKTYGVKALPPRTGDGQLVFEERHWRLIENLRTRELTGSAARTAIADAFNSLSAASAQLLGRILRKDLRAGFSESTTNKAFPKLIPEFAYMRCSLPTDVKLAEWPWAEGVVSQEKADGMFANVDVDLTGVTIRTRQGNEVPMEALGDLPNQMAKFLMLNHQHHGEILVQQRIGDAWAILPREEGNGILNSIGKGGEMPDGHRAIYLAWDAVPLSAVQPKGRFETPYGQRLQSLRDAMEAMKVLEADPLVGLVPMRIVRSMEEALVHYREMLEAGKEGTVIKRLDNPWADGTSRGQVKLKLEVDVELEIVGFNPGTGKNAKTFGSIIGRSSCGRLVVNVNARSDKSRADINARREELTGTIMTVRFNLIMKPKKPGELHSLFLPRLMEMRQDKTQADSLERIFAQFEAAVRGETLPGGSQQESAVAEVQ